MKVGDHDIFMAPFYHFPGVREGGRYQQTTNRIEHL